MSYTLYDILEVSSRASPEMIRAAYRSLARRHHPDRNRGHGSAERMAQINRAYKILSDPLKRKDYDASLVVADDGISGQTRQPRRAREPRAADETATQRAPPNGAGAHAREWARRAAADTPSRSRFRESSHAVGPLPPPKRMSTKKQWILLLSFGGVLTVVAGALAYMLKDVEVSDPKEIAIAGQWKRYNEMTPHQAAEAYFTGRGAPLNYDKARALYLKIAAESRARKTPAGLLDERGRLALRRLGEMYARGLGVEADWLQARVFYEEAAGAGDIQSMSALGDYYAREQAAEADLLAAYSWYNKLAAVTPGTYAFATASDSSETYRMLAEAPRKRDALQKRLAAEELRRAQSF